MLAYHLIAPIPSQSFDQHTHLRANVSRILITEAATNNLCHIDARKQCYIIAPNEHNYTSNVQYYRIHIIKIIYLIDIGLL